MAFNKRASRFMWNRRTTKTPQPVLHLRREAIEPDRTSYRGYLIVRSPFDGAWRVYRDTYYIASAATLPQAKGLVDNLLD